MENKKRLIDADDTIEEIRERVREGSIMCYADVYRAIHEQDTIDAVEVVHGRWEFRNDGRYRQTRCYCTACGKHSGIGGIRENQLKPYCPNCGAKMDGDENG